MYDKFFHLTKIHLDIRSFKVKQTRLALLDKDTSLINFEINDISE